MPFSLDEEMQEMFVYEGDSRRAKKKKKRTNGGGFPRISLIHFPFAFLRSLNESNTIFFLSISFSVSLACWLRFDIFFVCVCISYFILLLLHRFFPFGFGYCSARSSFHYRSLFIYLCFRIFSF